MRIGELAGASGTTTKTLRFYEEAGLLPAPQRTSAGYRDYGPEAVQRLDFIRRSRRAGLTLNQIRDVLRVRDRGIAPCTHVRELLGSRLGDLDRQIVELQSLRDTVAELHDAAATVDPAHCDPAEVCRYV